MRTAIRLACAVVLMAAVAACGDSTGDGTTTEAPSTTVTPNTTEPVITASPTTAAPPTSTTSPPVTTAAPTTTQPDTNALADGSGCTPGLGTLPDGRWFGFVAAAGAEAVEFDLACMFSGDAAVLAAAEDGEESPPPNGYHIRNANTQLRAVEVDDDTDVRWYPNVGDPQTGRTDPYDTWRVEGAEVTGERPGFVLGVWLTMEDGEVTHIEEQWVP